MAAVMMAWWVSLRRFLASLLTYVPWTCHALLLAWGEIGGRNLLLRGLAPGAARECIREAAEIGECYCLRFVSKPERTHVYVATRTEVDRLRRKGEQGPWA